MLGVASVVLRAAGCQFHPFPESYDDWVAGFGSSVVSYWKFENTGVDQKGTENAVIIGNPELNVETIVDLDTIAEGAPDDGKCIAWPGTAGTFAEVAHNPAHKTAEGTIVVTFQRDSLIAKSTLVAADRPVGGAAKGPGGFSIEVEPDGALRCFLRRQGDGAAVIMLGEPGDAVRNQAYTLIFKWGPAGLSVALWDENGTLVRRRTNPLTDGVTGTSPIRFGVWHDGTSSPHDGPFGRVIWLDHQISVAREADLARARTINRAPASGGDYAPFPFITISNPTLSHAGVASRPGYSPSDPLSASIIDPMSGIQIFRLGGLNGQNVLINGSTDSGVDFPQVLRNENNSKGFKVWNADSTLLAIDRYYNRGNAPSALCTSYIVDVDGSHGTGGPWRIIKANFVNLGGNYGSGWWFWDVNNPLRAWAIGNDGRHSHWYPIGAPGKSVGQLDEVWGPFPAGYGSGRQGDDRPGACTPTPDGRYVTIPCRRNSDGRWGGFIRDLTTGELSNFIGPEIFGYSGSGADHPDRSAGGCSAAGNYVGFNENGSRFRFRNRSNQTIADTSPIDQATHTCMTLRDGVEYYCGVRTDNVSMLNLAAGTWEQKITTNAFSGANPNHLGALNWNDTFETYGATGAGNSTGVRYFLYTRANPRNGHPRGIMGIRCGVNDTNVFRYICNHRSVRFSNESECHAQMDPNAKYVVFSSNWEEPGVASGNQVNPYVAILPDGWYSPNNDGS